MGGGGGGLVGSAGLAPVSRQFDRILGCNILLCSARAPPCLFVISLALGATSFG